MLPAREETTGLAPTSLANPVILAFSASENTAQVGQVDNLTANAGNVQINAKTGTLYVLVCTSSPNNGLPAAGLPYVLDKMANVAISNVVPHAEMVAGWYILPHTLTNGRYPHFPTVTIDNYQYRHGVYYQTKFWADPVINILEVFSWVGLCRMMQFVLWRGKP